MVEVFKTNVSSREAADRLLTEIHDRFPHYQATFDLTDCDRILRVHCASQEVLAHHLIDLLDNKGYCAAILEDLVHTEASLQTKK